jgi:hypothetical protein
MYDPTPNNQDSSCEAPSQDLEIQEVPRAYQAREFPSLLHKSLDIPSTVGSC